MKNRSFLTLVGLTALTITFSACDPQQNFPGNKDGAPMPTTEVDSGTVGLDASAPSTDVPITTPDSAHTIDSDLGPKLLMVCASPTCANGTQFCQLNGGSCTPCVCDGVDAGNTVDTTPIITPDTAPASTDATPVALDMGSDTIATQADTQGNSPDVQAPPVCVAVREICENGADDDCDGLVDETFDCVTGTGGSSGTGGTTTANTTTGCTSGDLRAASINSCGFYLECKGGSWTVVPNSMVCANGSGGSVGTGGVTGTGGSTATGGATGFGGTTAAGDTVSPIVGNLSVSSTLTVGVLAAFSVTASDNVAVTGCQMKVDGVVMADMTSVVSGVWAATGTPSASQIGTHAFVAVCRDAAGNTGSSNTLSLTVVAAPSGTGGTVGTGGSTGTGTSTGTGGSTTAGCNHVLVNNQYMDIPDGQVITCGANGKEGQQKCANGLLSPCVAMSDTTSGLRAVVNCTPISAFTGKVVLTGNVVGNFYTTADASAIAQVCLVGDTLGGMDANNRTYCLSYRSDSSFSYVFDALPFASGENRITFIGVTANGGVRWSNNSIIVYANDPANRCTFSSVIVDQTTSKLVYKTQ